MKIQTYAIIVKTFSTWSEFQYYFVLHVRNPPSLSSTGPRKDVGVPKRALLAETGEPGVRVHRPRGEGSEVVVGGDDAELANPSGFPELPKLNLFSFMEVSNQETFLSAFPLPRLCILPPKHAMVGPLPLRAQH